jgi:hypothetical protein
VRERTDARAIGDGRVFENAALQNLHAIAEDAVFDNGKRPDPAIGADARAAKQLGVGLDDRARGNLNIGIDDARVGPVDVNSGSD